MGCERENEIGKGKGKGVDGRKWRREREEGVIRVPVMKAIRAVGFVLGQWRSSVLRGSQSLLRLGSAALLLILWSTFLALTSLTCLCYLLSAMASAFGAVVYLGFTPGLFIVGLFAILILWMFANFWIAGTLFLVAGYLFSLNHARVLVLLASAYAVYSVQTRVGWVGVFLALNLSFFSNDAFASLLRWCDNVREAPETKQQQHENTTFSNAGEGQPHTAAADQPEIKQAAAASPPPPKPPPATATPPPPPPPLPPRPAPAVSAVSSPDEMKRILESGDHYQALGLQRHKTVDLLLLKKEYRKKAMLVHPDKNMGSPLASESFKKLQCAYEVLSDLTKKQDYDEQLRKKESITKTVRERSNRDYCSEESRRIQCTKCGNSHIWVCTSRSKGKARWCQDCCQYHHAKDGDGWVEYKGSLVFDTSHKVEIPRAFVCAESKIFDVSEWAICQGMACRPNTHRPSFHVNMVGLEKSESRYPWDLDAEMMDEEEEEFEVWLQQALASGLFCETSKRRKSWSPFKLHQLSKTKKQWRRTSC